jgi:hypothetical protein
MGQGADWINLIHNRYQLKVLVNMIMKRFEVFTA